MGGYKKIFEDGGDVAPTQIDNTMKRVKLTEAMIGNIDKDNPDITDYHKVNIKYAKKNGEIVEYTITPFDISDTVVYGIDTKTSDVKEFVLDRITEITNG